MKTCKASPHLNPVNAVCAHENYTHDRCGLGAMLRGYQNPNLCAYRAEVCTLDMKWRPCQP